MSSSGRNTMALVFPALNAEQHREPFGTNPLAVEGHSTPLAGVSCLLVEGDHDAAKDAAMLECSGAGVVHVRTAREGVLALARSPWELVVVDENLPDGSGYQVVAYAAVARSDAAILVVTDAGQRPPLPQPFEGVFTFLERALAIDRLVSCARLALIEASGGESPHSFHGDETLSPNESLAFDIATRYQLTPRQRQVLTLLIAGSPPKKIAECLAISTPTMRRHAEELYRKCGVRSQRELLALVARSTATARLA